MIMFKSSAIMNEPYDCMFNISYPSHEYIKATSVYITNKTYIEYVPVQERKTRKISTPELKFVLIKIIHVS